MPSTVEALTGPGRRIKVNIDKIDTIKFDLKRSVVEIVEPDGNMTEYDLANLQSMGVTTPNGVFTLNIKAKP